MKQTKLALSAVMVVAISLTGIVGFATGIESVADELPRMGEPAGFLGHITLVHSDSDGNILSYAQTDNRIVNEGKNCAMELLFGTTGAGDCAATATSGDLFDFIGLTDTQSFGYGTNASSLNAADITGSGLDPAIGTVQNFVAAVGADYGSSSTGASVDIDKTFTATATQATDGAILYNGANDAVFAGQKFTSVTLNNLDTLQVTWTITLGTTT